MSIRKLTLRQLEAFFWVSKLASFQAAARYLGTTQPAISARIKEVEGILDIQLFERQREGVIVTDKGQELLVYAEKILSLTDELQSRASIKATTPAHIRIGLVDSIALTWLPRLIADMASRYPHASVELEIDFSIELLRLLHNGKVDVAFLVGPVQDLELETQELGALNQAWIASPRVAIPRQPATAAGLAAHPILCHARGGHQHLLVDTWFRAEGVTPQILCFCSSLSTVVHLTTKGAGLSVLPPRTLSSQLASGELQVVRTINPLPDLHFVAAYHKDNPHEFVRWIVDYAYQASLAHPAFVSSAFP